MAAPEGKTSRSDLSLFAWHGLNVRVPADWDMVSTQNSRRGGYVGLADEHALRLEMRWETVRGKPDPADAATTYIQGLRDQAKKDRTEIRVRREVRLASFKDRPFHCYEWTAPDQGAGMAVRCDQCGRMVHVVVRAARGADIRGLARGIFASLRDHPEGERQLWCFYDVEFSCPRRLTLQRSELKTGCIRMEFAGRRRRLEFVRVSMAQLLVSRQSLRDWFRDFYGENLKRWRFRIEDREVKGHPGLAAQGRDTLLLNPGKLLGLGRSVQIACWHCEPSNRLMIVRHVGPPEDAGEFDRAVDGMRCCPRRGQQ